MQAAFKILVKQALFRLPSIKRTKNISVLFLFSFKSYILGFYKDDLYRKHLWFYRCLSHQLRTEQDKNKNRFVAIEFSFFNRDLFDLRKIYVLNLKISRPKKMCYEGEFASWDLSWIEIPLYVCTTKNLKNDLYLFPISYFFFRLL